MKEHLVDARGELCPRPLILTKQALSACLPGQPVRILIDNEISKDNVMTFLSDNGVEAECVENGGIYSLLLYGAERALSRPDAAAYCAPERYGKPHVIVVKSNRMGTGDDSLGELLLRAFITTIKEVSPLPGAIVFYNSGIFLTLDESPVLGELRDLEGRGVKLYICGTCADYYGKRGEVRVGVISNMYTIMETVTTAAKVIEP